MVISSLIGSKFKAGLAVTGAVTLAAVFWWQSSTISSLEEEVKGLRDDVSVCSTRLKSEKSAVKELTSLIQEKNKEINNLADRAEQANARADQAARDVLMNNHPVTDDEAAETAKEMNEWFEQQL